MCLESLYILRCKNIVWFRVASSDYIALRATKMLILDNIAILLIFAPFSYDILNIEIAIQISEM
jgi:hypothetical protein